MIRASIGTTIRFPYNGKTYERKLHEVLEIGYDYWLGDIGWLDENEPLPSVSFMVTGLTSNGVPVLHKLSVRVDGATSELITEGITFKAPKR